MAQVVTPATVVRKSGGFGGSVRDFLTYSPGKVKPQIIVLFCRQLASFVRVGVPVTTAIETFAEQATTKKLRDTYYAVAADIQRGVRLSDAFAAHPKVFPRIIPDMVRSAEVTGNLDVVLKQAAGHIEREASARQKIRAAMMYPSVVAGFALVILTGIIVFVLPKFSELYASLGVKTPAILNGLLGVSNYVNAHGIAIIVGVLIGFVLLGIGARTERGRYARDWMVVRMPAVREIAHAAMIERFCRTLSSMLSAGVPIGQTYVVVMENVRNRVYRKSLVNVGPALAAGHGIYRPLQQTKAFPPAVIQMFRVGEETGHLDTNLEEAADMYEQDLDYRIKRLTALLEPAMIVFVGLIVGFIAVTLITSIYSIAGNYK
ncbi:MAG: type II secretion system F family protein [Candidatus Dormibacteria bacterium]